MKIRFWNRLHLELINSLFITIGEQNCHQSDFVLMLPVGLLITIGCWQTCFSVHQTSNCYHNMKRRNVVFAAHENFFFLEEEIRWRSLHALQLAGYFTFSWSVIKFLLFVFSIRFFEPRLSHFKRISGLSLQLFLLEHLDRRYSERTGCVVRLHSFSQQCASVWILQMFYCSAVEMTDFLYFFLSF